MEMPLKEKEKVEVTATGRMNSSFPSYPQLATGEKPSSNKPSSLLISDPDHGPQINSTTEISNVGISLDSYGPNMSLEVHSPQPHKTSNSNGIMGSEEDVRINITESDTQSSEGPQTQCLTPEREIPYIIHCDGERRTEYLTLCVPLYQAAMNGDWKVAKAVIRRYPDVVRIAITNKWETALHIAAAAKRTAFVMKLVRCMRQHDLALKNKDGNTAVCFAAASGVVDIAKVMIEINENLPMVRGNRGMTPLFMAALFGHRDMVLYLYSKTEFGSLTYTELIKIFLATISANLYDVALQMLERDSSLATSRDQNGETALHLMARKPSSIASKSQLGFWKRLINSSFGEIYQEALMRTLAQQLVEKLWKEVLQLPDWEISNFIRQPSRLLFDAAALGNTEFLIILIRSYPDLIWKVNDEGQSLFHVAVLNRQESIFNIIYELGAIKDLISFYTDESKNNMLHLAANSPPPDRLQIVSGAALQMQRELLWFEAVKKIVPPSYIKMKNSKDKLPWNLFTENHRTLQKEGEKWMKSTANSCMLVATLIATVVFAAAFTVPGGSNNETGTPILEREKWFTIFLISDAVAMFSSSTSIIIFLSILTSTYTEADFLVLLPSWLMLGLSALFISITTMVLAFSATLILIHNHKLAWIPIVVFSLACVTATSFVMLHRRLWVDTIRSTYWSKFLFQTRKHRLYR